MSDWQIIKIGLNGQPRRKDGWTGSWFVTGAGIEPGRMEMNVGQTLLFCDTMCLIK